jgi:hypothetical protein
MSFKCLMDPDSETNREMCAECDVEDCDLDPSAIEEKYNPPADSRGFEDERDYRKWVQKQMCN